MVAFSTKNIFKKGKKTRACVWIKSWEIGKVVETIQNQDQNARFSKQTTFVSSNENNSYKFIWINSSEINETILNQV